MAESPAKRAKHNSQPSPSQGSDDEGDEEDADDEGDAEYQPSQQSQETDDEDDEDSSGCDEDARQKEAAAKVAKVHAAASKRSAERTCTCAQNPDHILLSPSKIQNIAKFLKFCTAMLWWRNLTTVPNVLRKGSRVLRPLSDTTVICEGCQHNLFNKKTGLGAAPAESTRLYIQAYGSAFANSLAADGAEPDPMTKIETAYRASHMSSPKAILAFWSLVGRRLVPRPKSCPQIFQQDGKTFTAFGKLVNKTFAGRVIPGYPNNIPVGLTADVIDIPKVLSLHVWNLRGSEKAAQCSVLIPRALLGDLDWDKNEQTLVEYQDALTNIAFFSLENNPRPGGTQSDFVTPVEPHHQTETTVLDVLAEIVTLTQHFSADGRRKSDSKPVFQREIQQVPARAFHAPLINIISPPVGPAKPDSAPSGDSDLNFSEEELAGSMQLAGVRGRTDLSDQIGKSATSFDDVIPVRSEGDSDLDSVYLEDSGDDDENAWKIDGDGDDPTRISGHPLVYHQFLPGILSIF